VLEKNHSPFKAGHTLNANAVSCAGAIAVINYMRSHDLAANAAARGEQALDGLRKSMAAHPSIGDVRGRGLMFGFEFVRDRATKEPFPLALKVSSLLEQAALRHGLVTYPCTGTVDGGPGDMVLMAPPLTITAQEMDDLLTILDLAIGEVEETIAEELRIAD
jgi:adenosylmethionine-8-amino-7-oxononanoate aminotransferase